MDIKKLKETITKKNKIFKLIDEIHYPVLLEYFDFESDKDLDKKIEVLEQLKDGKDVSEIDGFWEILELYPDENAVV